MGKQIRLSTVFLLIAVTGLALGLLVQFRQHRAELKHARKNEWFASQVNADSLLANRLLMYKPDRFSAWSRTKVVTLIRLLWKNETQYDGHDKGPYVAQTASEVASEILRCAKISSHQQLLDYATQHTFYNRNNEDDVSYLDAEGIRPDVPELYDPNSREYANFKSFVERSLAR